MENVIQVNENLILHYKRGLLCKVEKPLDKIVIKIDSDGTKHWLKNGKHNRDNDLPAVEWADGTKYWFKNGQYYRDNDLPAIKYASGTKYWFKNGLRHRDNDLPAIEWEGGSKFWYKNGQFIREEICH